LFKVKLRDDECNFTLIILLFCLIKIVYIQLFKITVIIFVYSTIL